MLPILGTYNTYMRSFQYKILKSSPLCYSFCKLYDETPFHIFHECDRAKCLWLDLVQCFRNSLILPPLTPWTAIFWDS